MISYTSFINYILPFILRFEGGYVNDPDDSGGKTYRGITYKNFPNWQGWKILNSMNLQHNQIVASVEPLVISFYWNLFKGYGYHNFSNAKLALVVFDYRVNGGFTFDKLAAILNKFFNKKSQLSATSIIQNANKVSAETLANHLLNNRESYYNTIIQKNPVLEKYRHGWFNRLTILRAYTNLNKIAVSGALFLAIGIGIALTINK